MLFIQLLLHWRSVLLLCRPVLFLLVLFLLLRRRTEQACARVHLLDHHITHPMHRRVAVVLFQSVSFHSLFHVIVHPTPCHDRRCVGIIEVVKSWLWWWYSAYLCVCVQQLGINSIWLTLASVDLVLTSFSYHHCDSSRRRGYKVVDSRL